MILWKGNEWHMDTMLIQYFFAVHKYKGFTQAVQLLHLDQSNLSR